jgi:hypothetical protein
MRSLVTCNDSFRKRVETIETIRSTFATAKSEVIATHGWRSLPCMAAQGLVRLGPLGGVFAYSILTPRTMRALYLSINTFGSLMILTMFKAATGGALSKSAPEGCKPTKCTADAMTCLGARVGNMIAFGVTTVVIAGVPSMLIGQLHVREFVQVDWSDGPGWNQILRRWRLRDGLTWAIGGSYCIFAINYVVLYFANVDGSDHLGWLYAAMCSTLQMHIIMPLFLSLFIPFLSLTMLSIVALWHSIPLHLMTAEGHVDKIKDYITQHSRKAKSDPSGSTSSLVEPKRMLHVDTA